jgi:hypothetical protein
MRVLSLAWVGTRTTEYVPFVLLVQGGEERSWVHVRVAGPAARSRRPSRGGFAAACLAEDARPR